MWTVQAGYANLLAVLSDICADNSERVAI